MEEQTYFLWRVRNQLGMIVRKGIVPRFHNITVDDIVNNPNDKVTTNLFCIQNYMNHHYPDKKEKFDYKEIKLNYNW
jgi:hypothetical protein